MTKLDNKNRLDGRNTLCHAVVMRANYRLQRLYLTDDLTLNSECVLQKPQAHYLRNVLRMGEGAQLLVFNGRDGEWLAEIASLRRKVVLIMKSQERPQPKLNDLIYCFAPLKTGRLDYLVQKAVELGASKLQPVFTQYTQVSRLNLTRIEANIIEAAEQCGVLALPQCAALSPLNCVLEEWSSARPLLFCDEGATQHNPLSVLAQLPKGPAGVLVGPEGGFSDQERKKLRACGFVTPLSLGPRILRADTAAVAALTLIGATLGDW